MSNDVSKEENMSKDVFITTHDNPYDYFKQFDQWYNFDQRHGYHTLEYIGRLIRPANDLSEEEQRLELENTIDKIIEWNGKFYKKVYSS